MKKNFSANLIFLVVLNLLVKPIYVFGIEVGIQNEVGTEAYGLYYAMFNFTFLFNVLLDIGINNYQKIKVAEDSVSGIGNMSTLIPLKVLLAGVYMIVTVAVAALIGFESQYWFFIGWLMVNHVLSAFLLLLRANLSGLQMFMQDSIVSVIDRLILILGIGYLLWFGNTGFRIEWFVLFQTLAYLVGIAFALGFTPRKYRIPKLNFSLKKGWQMVLNTWPFALLILLMTAYNKLDGIMIERLAENGLYEAGVYAQAYRLIDAGNSFAFLYAGMLLPVFARLLSKQNYSDLNRLIDQSSRYLIYPAGLAVLVVFYNSNTLMSLLYDREIVASSIAFEWLMGSFLFICIGYVYGTLLTASNNLRLLNAISAIAVVINFILNWILIPNMGAEGAAIASCSSLFFMSVAQVFAAYKTMSSPSFLWLVKSIVGWGLCGLLLYFISDQGLAESNFFAVSCMIALVLVLSLGFKKTDLKSMLPE